MGYTAIFDGLDATMIGQIQNWDLSDDDADGLPNGWETHYGLDDPAADGDTDGLTNLAEFEAGTNPTVADSDNDGLADGDEVTLGTDPNNTDTDGDSIGDGGEVNAGLDPLDPADGVIDAVGLLISDGILAGDRPWAAVDSAGNIHVVWSEENDNIRYKMLDADLNTLIDETVIGDETGLTGSGQRPQIAIGTDDKAYVVWTDDTEIYFQRLDPSLDDQSGDAADPTVLVETSADISGGESPYHAKFVMDDSNNLYIVSEDSSDLFYAKIDADGNELVSFTSFATINDDHRTPAIGIDSNGNAHVSWTDNAVTLEEELYYAMLNGLDGSVLIDATLLTPDDDSQDKHTNLIVVDDLVTIIWGGCCTDSIGKEIYLIRLDPSLDDQSTDAADPAAITIVDQTLLTADNGNINWYITAILRADGDIDITDGAGSQTKVVRLIT